MEKGQGPGLEETEAEVGSEAGTRGWNADAWLWEAGLGQLLGSERNISPGLPRSGSTPYVHFSKSPGLWVAGVLVYKASPDL